MKKGVPGQDQGPAADDAGSSDQVKDQAAVPPPFNAPPPPPVKAPPPPMAVAAGEYKAPALPKVEDDLFIQAQAALEDAVHTTQRDIDQLEEELRQNEREGEELRAQIKAFTSKQDALREEAKQKQQTPEKLDEALVKNINEIVRPKLTQLNDAAKRLAEQRKKAQERLDTYTIALRQAGQLQGDAKLLSQDLKAQQERLVAIAKEKKTTSSEFKAAKKELKEYGERLMNENFAEPLSHLKPKALLKVEAEQAKRVKKSAEETLTNLQEEHQAELGKLRVKSAEDGILALQIAALKEEMKNIGVQAAAAAGDAELSAEYKQMMLEIEKEIEQLQVQMKIALVELKEKEAQFAMDEQAPQRLLKEATLTETRAVARIAHLEALNDLLKKGSGAAQAVEPDEGPQRNIDLQKWLEKGLLSPLEMINLKKFIVGREKALDIIEECKARIRDKHGLGADAPVDPTELSALFHYEIDKLYTDKEVIKTYNRMATKAKGAGGIGALMAAEPIDERIIFSIAKGFLTRPYNEDILDPLNYKDEGGMYLSAQVKEARKLFLQQKLQALYGQFPDLEKTAEIPLVPRKDYEGPVGIDAVVEYVKDKLKDKAKLGRGVAMGGKGAAPGAGGAVAAKPLAPRAPLEREERVPQGEALVAQKRGLKHVDSEKILQEREERLRQINAAAESPAPHAEDLGAALALSGRNPKMAEMMLGNLEAKIAGGEIVGAVADAIKSLRELMEAEKVKRAEAEKAVHELQERLAELERLLMAERGKVAQAAAIVDNPVNIIQREQGTQGIHAALVHAIEAHVQTDRDHKLPERSTVIGWLKVSVKAGSPYMSATGEVDKCLSEVKSKLRI